MSPHLVCMDWGRRWHWRGVLGQADGQAVIEGYLQVGAGLVHVDFKLLLFQIAKGETDSEAAFAWKYDGGKKGNGFKCLLLRKRFRDS